MTSVSDTVAQFFSTFPMRTYDKRQILIHPGEPLPGVFFMAEGRVSQYDVTTAGNEVVVNVFKPGAFFPMSTALNSTPVDYIFEAASLVKVHVAPPDAAVQFLQDNPAVALDLLKRVYRGVDGILGRMVLLMGGDAKHRLLFEILNAAYRFGEPQADGSLLVALSETDLGKRSGLARETVNRNMHALKETGLLKAVRGGLSILNLKKLEALLND